MSISSIPKALRAEVFRRDGGRCRYCGVLQLGQSAVFHINHIIPRAKRGATLIDNLALQCPHCSLHKADKTHAPDPAFGPIVRLFHPLTDDWKEHFSMAVDGKIDGNTDIGRATVAALLMNEPWPQSARALQIAAGWISEHGDPLE